MLPSGNTSTIIIDQQQQSSSLNNQPPFSSNTYEPPSHSAHDEGATLPLPPSQGGIQDSSLQAQLSAAKKTSEQIITTNENVYTNTNTHKPPPPSNADSHTDTDTDSTNSLSDDSLSSSSHSHSITNSNSNSSNMNWFNKRKDAEKQKAKEEAKRKTTQAEIRYLLESGTTEASLEAMFSPDDVALVVQQIARETAILKMCEAEMEASAEKLKAKHAEIRELLDAGTQVEVLEQMYSSRDVKDVVAAKAKADAAEEATETTANNSSNAELDPSLSEQQEEEEAMTEEDRAEMMAEIKVMLKGNTKMSTMESLYKHVHIQEAQTAMRQEQEQEQLEAIQSALSNLQPHSKLVLQLQSSSTSSESLAKEYQNPVYHISSQTSKGSWKLIFKSKPLLVEDNDVFKEAKVSLQKLLHDTDDTETPVRIEVLQENKSGQYQSVGHAETTLPEMMKSAIASDTSNKDNIDSVLEILDRKHNTVATLIVAKAAIVAHQETKEERAAKSKINKTLKAMEATSKLSLTLRAVHMEEERNQCQPFIRVQVQTAAAPASMTSINSSTSSGWETIYTSEPILTKLDAWRPTKISCSKIIEAQQSVSVDDNNDAFPLLRISMMDWNHGKIAKPMGSFVTTLNDLLWKAESNKVSVKILDEEDKVHPCVDDTYDEEYGSIIIKEASIQKMSSEEKTARKDIASLLQDVKEHSRLCLDMRGTDLEDAKGFLYEVEGQLDGNNTWASVFKSEVIKADSEPDWKKANLPLGKLLLGGDISTKIKLSLYAVGEKGEKNKPMGSCQTTVVELLLRSETSIAARAMANDLPFSCFDDTGHRYGSLVVCDADIEEETEKEKEARIALASSLDQIDEYSSLQLALKGTNLANMDGMFGVSDPFFIVLSAGEIQGQWEPVYRSEHVDDNLNPVWKKASIPLEKLVHGNTEAQFRIAMYDFEGNGSHQAMGYFDTSVKELLWRSKSNVAAKAIGEDTPFVCHDDGGTDYGSIVVVESAIVTETTEEKAARREILDTLHAMDPTARIKVSLTGSSLVNMDGIMGASDPFFEIQKQTVDGEWTTVYKSEHIDDNLNPAWRKATISVADLVVGDNSNPNIRIALTDWEESGKHQPMGYFELQLMDMLWFAETNKIAISLGEDRTFPCRDTSGKQYGTMSIAHSSLVIDSEDEVAARAGMKTHLETASPKANIILKFKGKDLANVEGWLGCSDPFFEIVGWTAGEGWKAVYRSEHIENNLNPEWKPATIPIHALLAGDADRKLKVLLFDWEEDQRHQPMGYFETTLLDLLWRSLTNEVSTESKEDRAYIARAQDEKDFGEILVESVSIETLNTIATKMKKRDSVWANPSFSKEQQSTSGGLIPMGSELLLSFKGINLANVEERFGCSDPFFELAVVVDELAVSEEWRNVYTSKHLENCLNPEWEEAAVSLDSLLKGGDSDREVRVSVFDWEDDENHNPMGSFKTNIEELLQFGKAYSSEYSKVTNSLFTLKDDSEREFGTIVVVGALIKKPHGAPKSLLTSPFVSPSESSPQNSVLQLSPLSGRSLSSIPDLGKGLGSASESKEKDADDLSDVDVDADEQGSDYSDAEMSNGSDEGSNYDGSDGGPDDQSLSGDEAGGSDGEGSGGDDQESRGSENRSDGGSISSALRDLQQGSAFCLSLMGADLANVEGWFGCSDPFFELSTLVEGDDEENWAAKYTSEHIDNNLSPIWKPATISMDALLDGDLDHVDLPILVSIFDWEANGEHRPIGDFETTLDELISKVNEARATREEVTFELEDYDGNSQGKILVVGAVVVPPNDEKSDRLLHLTLEGAGMANVEGWFGCSDPFYRVQSLTGDAWNNVYQSEHIENSLDPKWKMASISVELLCAGDMDTPLQISIFDWDPSGKFTPMGFYRTSASALLNMASDEESSSFAVKDEEGNLLGTVLIRDIHMDSIDESAREDAVVSNEAMDDVVGLDGSEASKADEDSASASNGEGNNALEGDDNIDGSEANEIEGDGSIDGSEANAMEGDKSNDGSEANYVDAGDSVDGSEVNGIEGDGSIDGSEANAMEGDKNGDGCEVDEGSIDGSEVNGIEGDGSIDGSEDNAMEGDTNGDGCEGDEGSIDGSEVNGIEGDGSIDESEANTMEGDTNGDGSEGDEGSIDGSEANYADDGDSVDGSANDVEGEGSIAVSEANASEGGGEDSIDGSEANDMDDGNSIDGSEASDRICADEDNDAVNDGISLDASEASRANAAEVDHIEQGDNSLDGSEVSRASAADDGQVEQDDESLAGSEASRVSADERGEPEQGENSLDGSDVSRVSSHERGKREQGDNSLDRSKVSQEDGSAVAENDEEVGEDGVEDSEVSTKEKDIQDMSIGDDGSQSGKSLSKHSEQGGSAFQPEEVLEASQGQATGGDDDDLSSSAGSREGQIVHVDQQDGIDNTDSLDKSGYSAMSEGSAAREDSNGGSIGSQRSRSDRSHGSSRIPEHTRSQRDVQDESYSSRGEDETPEHSQNQHDDHDGSYSSIGKGDTGHSRSQNSGSRSEYSSDDASKSYDSRSDQDRSYSRSGHDSKGDLSDHGSADKSDRRSLSSGEGSKEGSQYPDGDGRSEEGSQQSVSGREEGSGQQDERSQPQDESERGGDGQESPAEDSQHSGGADSRQIEEPKEELNQEPTEDVVDSQGDSKADSNGDIAEKSTEIDHEKEQLITEIKQLYEVGTQAMVLEQMFDPAIVAEAIAQVDGEKGDSKKGDASDADTAGKDETVNDQAEGSDGKVQDSSPTPSVKGASEADSEVQPATTDIASASGEDGAEPAPTDKPPASTNDATAPVITDTTPASNAAESAPVAQSFFARAFDMAAPVDSAKVKTLEDKINELEASLGDFKQKNGDLKASLGDFKQKNGDLQSTNDSLEQKLIDTNLKADELSKDSDSLREENVSLKETNESLETTRDDLNKQIEEVQQQNKVLEERCVVLDKNNSSMEEICNDLKKSSTEAEKKNNALQATCDELKESVSDYRKKASTLEATCEELQEHKNTLQAKNDTLQKKSSTMETSYDDMKQEKDDLQESLDEIEEKNAEMDEALKIATTEKAVALKDLEDFKATTAIKENRFLKSMDALTAKKDSLEADLASAKNGGASATSELKEENEQLKAKITELEATIESNESRMATAKNLVDSLGEARKEITTLTDQNKNLQAKLVLIAGGQPVPAPAPSTSTSEPNPTDGTAVAGNQPKQDGEASRTHDKSPSRSHDKSPSRSHDKSPRRSGEGRHHSSKSSVMRDESKKRDHKGGSDHKSMRDTSKKHDSGDRRREHRDRDKDGRDKDGNRLRRSETRDGTKDPDRKLRRSETKDGSRDADRKLRRSETANPSSRDAERKLRRSETVNPSSRESKDPHRRSSGDREKDKVKSSGDRERRSRRPDDKDKDKDRDRHRSSGDKDKDRDRDRDRDRRREKEKSGKSPRRPSESTQTSRRSTNSRRPSSSAN